MAAIEIVDAGAQAPILLAQEAHQPLAATRPLEMTRQVPASTPSFWPVAVNCTQFLQTLIFTFYPTFFIALGPKVSDTCTQALAILSVSLTQIGRGPSSPIHA